MIDIKAIYYFVGVLSGMLAMYIWFHKEIHHKASPKPAVLQIHQSITGRDYL